MLDPAATQAVHMPALCGNSLVTVFLLHIITKFASMNHWQKMSKEIPSHYQVRRYGRLIYPYPGQRLLAKSPRTFNAATQTNRAKPLPDSHFSSNSSFFCLRNNNCLHFISSHAVQHALRTWSWTMTRLLQSLTCFSPVQYLL